MISLKEIGRICGLSESTVSKALKGNPAIRRSTAQRVAEVARKYGYQPNAMVQCMQTGQSRSIGIILATGGEAMVRAAYRSGEALHGHGRAGDRPGRTARVSGARIARDKHKTLSHL